MPRSVVFALALAFSMLTLAAPAFACGGLIGPNGAVNLLRTTTFVGYHDGVEHYVTAFQFAGGGGKFGSLTPLPVVELATIVVGLPVIAAAAGWGLAGREPRRFARRALD